MILNTFVDNLLSSCHLRSRLVGKEQRIAEVKKLLATTRLLTITGSGGSGKTQLGLHVMADLQQGFEQPVWWIDVATLADPSALLQAIAKAPGIQIYGERPLIDIVLDFLSSQKEAWLIIDHCEHLISSCASLVEQILYTCRGIRMLVISQEALRITDEVIWRLPLLSRPGSQPASTPQELMQYEAVQLFVERASQALPSFTLTQKNMETVTQICCRLEGHPLAIALAATRVKVLSPREILIRLDNCRSLLGDGCQADSPRHHTIWTTTSYSYDLLSRKEQLLFQRLAVFPACFSLEAAEAVGADEKIEAWEILHLLSRLVDKSLVIVEEQEEEVCYHLLETARQYGRQKLHEANEETITNKRYHAWQSDRRQGYIQIVDTSMALRIFALGSVRVYRREYLLTSADWRYGKARELLFYLLSHRAKTKEQIGLALWPDASSTLLRSTFHTTLHHLRKALGHPDWIAFKDGYYSFHRLSDFWFDVELFEACLQRDWQSSTSQPAQTIQHLQEAVRYYQGDFLEDLLGGDWYLTRQRELRQQFLDAQFTLGRLFFAEKQYAQAAEIYRQIIAYDSYLEVAHRELIRCYVSQGERGLALRHYQILERAMRDEFGSLPSAETMALYELLRRGEEMSLARRSG